MKTPILTSMAIGLLSLSTLSFASAYESQLFGEDDYHNAPSDFGLYVGASAGMISGKTNSYAIIEEDEAIWKAYAGYEISDTFAIEGAYHDLGEQNFTAIVKKPEDDDDGTRSAIANSSALSIAALYRKKINDNITGFAKGGLASWRTDGSVYQYDEDTDLQNDGVDVLMGIGATMDMGENLKVRGEFERIGGDVDANMFTVGAQYQTL